MFCFFFIFNFFYISAIYNEWKRLTAARVFLYKYLQTENQLQVSNSNINCLKLEQCKILMRDCSESVLLLNGQQSNAPVPPHD